MAIITYLKNTAGNYSFCSADGGSTNQLPVLTRSVKESIVLNFLDELGEALTIPTCSSFNFALAKDWVDSTPPEVLVTEGITQTSTSVTITVNPNTAELIAALSGKKSETFTAELKGYALVGGEVTAVLICQFTIVINNLVYPGSGVPTELEADYYLKSEVDALFSAGYEIEFSIDGATLWHETQSLANDKYYRYRNADLSGNWSDAIGLIQGTTGAAAPAVQFQYSTDNTSYHGTYTTGDIYLKLSTDGGSTWTVGMRFIGATGATGATGAAGQNAPVTQFQYSVDNSSFHATYTSSDIYIRVSVDGGTTWGSGMRLKGETGAPGADGQFENGVPDYEFATSNTAIYNSSTKIFTIPFATLGVTGKVPTEIFDSSGYSLEGDPRLVKSWSTTALVLDVSRISGFDSGIVRCGGGIESSLIGDINSILDSINGEVL